MTQKWFYTSGGKQVGPVELETLEGLAREGKLAPRDLVWSKTLTDWSPAEKVLQAFSSPPPPPLPARVPDSTQPPRPAPAANAPPRGIVREAAKGLSDLAKLPTISDVPIKSILFSGLGSSAGAISVEEAFAVGTSSTTPDLADLPSGWPRPRVCWRILFGVLVAYVLMRFGLTSFKNTNFIPGILVIGSFVVPLAIVVFFLEMNTPRNVSTYQVLKMTLVGGAVSLVATMFVHEVIPGSGVVRLVPAMLTGLVEELGKLLALLLLVRDPRYRWQVNGVLFGSAVGAGFAGLESAGYAFNSLLEKLSAADMFDSITLRGILAPGGHVIWCAMVGGALWKTKGDRPFALGMLFHQVVVRRFLFAVVLHGLWDTEILSPRWNILGVPLQQIAITLVGWYIIFATLKQSLQEVEVAKTRALAERVENAI